MKKPTLKDRLESAEKLIREQEKALQNFAASCGVRVDLPPNAQSACSHELRDTVFELAKHLLEEYPVYVPGAPRDVSLHSNIFTRPLYGVLPEPVVQVMKLVLERLEMECLRSYKKGFEQGSSLLGRLVAGDITPDCFEDSLEREKARKANGFKL